MTSQLLSMVRPASLTRSVKPILTVWEVRMEGDGDGDEVVVEAGVDVVVGCGWLLLFVMLLLLPETKERRNTTANLGNFLPRAALTLPTVIPGPPIQKRPMSHAAN